MLLTQKQNELLSKVLPVLTAEIKVLFLLSLPVNLSIQERCDRIQALNSACLTINRCDLGNLLYDDEWQLSANYLLTIVKF